MSKIGFMFGAGAEIGYGLPTGGDFALNIFRQDVTESKNEFKNQRVAIDNLGAYARWLPIDYDTKNISTFRRKAFEDIIKSTVEQNRQSIIDHLNSLDILGNLIVEEMNENGIDIKSDFKEVNKRSVSDSFMGSQIVFVDEFKDGEAIFNSTYFSALLLAYKNLRMQKAYESTELGKVITAILQLQVGALGEKLTHRLNEGIFKKKDDDLDFLEDLGDIIQLNYQAVGMSGLEYLLDIHEPDTNTIPGRILYFAQILIEKIYSRVLDYKSLIDSNWMYLYHPKTEWSKFCKISIFLLNVRQYITSLFENVHEGRTGYYDDIATCLKQGKLEISAVGTSNYLPLIHNKLQNIDITYLNGSTDLWYDPYLNRIGLKEQLERQKHFIVPLLFTQSGTKPMISIDMSSRYVDYYNKLATSDEICVIGFGFNSDDEHINGLFRDLIEQKNKRMTVICLQGSKTEACVKEEIISRLKVSEDANISVICVDKNREKDKKIWIDHLLSSIN